MVLQKLHVRLIGRITPQVIQQTNRSFAWGYYSENGPPTWSKDYPNASGPRQSPVNIEKSLAKEIKWKNKISLHYEPGGSKELLNTGATWQVNFKNVSSVLRGGPGDGEHELKQFHAHWSKTDTEGSEHAIDSKKFSAELHFLHWNRIKYKTFEESLKQPDGLLVLAILLKIGKDNEELEKIIQLLPLVTNGGSKINIPKSQTVDPAAFYPKKSMCYTYPGSLTAPPCNECVVWVICEEPMEVSSRQLEVMRSLKTKGSKNLLQNIRPVCPLGDRAIGKFEL